MLIALDITNGFPVGRSFVGHDFTSNMRNNPPILMAGYGSDSSTRIIGINGFN
jgi:hypothetical protein